MLTIPLYLSFFAYLPQQTVELNWLDFANLGIEDLEGEGTFGGTKKEQERQRLGLGGLDRRILKRRRRQSQQ
jgi:hypothetical protein